MLTRHRVIEYLHRLGQRMDVSTWASYVSRGRAPRPDTYVETGQGRGIPLWHEDTVRVWAESRPGQGARTDLVKGQL